MFFNYKLKSDKKFSTTTIFIEHELIKVYNRIEQFNDIKIP